MTSPEEKLCIVAFPSDNKTEIGGGTGCHAADFAAIGLCGAFAYVSLMTRLYTCLCSVPKIKSSKDQTSVRRLTGHTVIWEASLQIVLLHCMNVIFRYSLAAAAPANYFRAGPKSENGTHTMEIRVQVPPCCEGRKIATAGK